ncbi:threonine synthase [Thermococcus sp. MV5]|uniref:threonine synthase n=1 Tax=Thermococcus sp. MV5 TaxID=1638272 RepID=UPI00143C77AE|nr:threonine synthase [Thermococcus sp. MV5]NJE25238.1 threonine synthase [Thermococcus sp. MV5]
MFVEKLVCSKCGSEFSPASLYFSCPKCGERLDIFYDYNKISEIISKDELKKRGPSVWKYTELLPIQDSSKIISLGEGGTPLIRSKRLAEKLGLRELYIKDETRNPTGSFKDRPIVVGISRVNEFGIKNVVTASSGNAAASLAAYSAKLGLNCVAFVPENAPTEKISQLRLYGAMVVRVKRNGFLGDPTVKMMELTHKEFGWAPVPSFGKFNPYQMEGPKTIAYEISEQLNYQVPDWVFIPVGGGGLFAGNYKGFKEFEILGFIDTIPHLVAIQSEGCAPLVKAWKEKKPLETWESPKTVAGGLADPYTWDWDLVFKGLRESKGIAEEVNDNLILEAQRLLARYEGIFVEPSGAASLAGLLRMLDEGHIDKGDSIVIEATGIGFKDLKSISSYTEEVPIIEPSLPSLKYVLEKYKLR